MRILYLMHVDWRFMKQRPQILAEHLSKHHEVMVLYRVNPFRKQLSGNESPIARVPFLPIPRKYGVWCERLDSFSQRFRLNAVSRRFHPDLVWMTYPTISSYLPESLRSIPAVYDCMDDAGEFSRDRMRARRVLSMEARLVREACRVLCSSKVLSDRMSERYGIAEKITLVRNGVPEEYAARLQEGNDGARENAAGSVNLAYFGFMSSWFDYQSVLRLLDGLPGLKIHLVGACDCQIPRHDRLVCHGLIDHSRLYEYVQQFDAFFMPFTVNRLIEAVDPVKLYEYLATGKPTISVRYREIERFEPYVHMYSPFDEMFGLAKKLCEGTLASKASKGQVLEFLKANTWSKRAEQVDEILSAIMSEERRLIPVHRP